MSTSAPCADDVLAYDKIVAVNDPCDGNPPLRIAHLTTTDMSLALLLAAELSERVEEGHHVLGISAPGSYVEQIESLGVRHVPIRSLSRSWGVAQDIRALITLRRTIRSLNLDVLHTHTPKAGVLGRIAGQLARVPVVVNTCHGLWATPQNSAARRAVVYAIEGLAARFSDFEFFQNSEDEHTMRRFLKRGRHQVVGNGIDLSRFTFDPESRRRLRAEWGVGDDELIVGTVGRRVREKGLAEFAEVADQLQGRARFFWIGPVDHAYASATKDLDLSRIEFIGERRDMPAVYSALDIFVLASHREGFSRASMEAAACSRPMALTDIRGCREVGDHEIHLLLFPDRDPHAFAASVTRLLEDPDLRRELGEAARRRALDAFDQRDVARASLEVYSRLLSAPAD